MGDPPPPARAGMTAATRRRVLQALAGSLLLPARGAAAMPRPLRVAAIDWAGAEAMLALGVVPVGLSDTRYYRERMGRSLLPEDVADIGPFWEVNMELLAELRPDVILASPSNIVAMPTLPEVAHIHAVPDAVPPEGRYALGAAILRDVAALLSREARAETLLAEAERAMGAAAEALARGPERPVFVLLPNGNGRSVIVYGRNSLPDAVLRRIGVRNAFNGRTNAAGVATIGVERLLAEPDALILMIDIPSARRRIDAAIAGSALWQALEPVRAGRMAFLPAFYPFGGVPSALGLAGELRARLSNPA
ncbi:ABC transporter substrate-binding protein [Aureimonas sp. ME7]|uniref:ABC transporter substrate-binding protein n=1 Tax=Aureimonas sp. ME7 TaxID=2744252 RepID=UPI0015F3C7DC|nr:ABC transporter substrate-binding protein [Aureimonas sp. ME7]